MEAENLQISDRLCSFRRYGGENAAMVMKMAKSTPSLINGRSFCSWNLPLGVWDFIK